MTWTRSFPFQDPVGTYHDDNLQRLDFVLDYGGKIGLRFACALVNNWKEFGGKRFYVQYVSPC